MTVSEQTIVEQMREACAKVADEYHKGLIGRGPVGRSSVNTARHIAAAIRALPIPASPVAVKDEAGWLIEEDAGGITHWIALAESQWPRYKVRVRSDAEITEYLMPVRRVKDANEALRFARKDDAEAFIKLFDRYLLFAVATEHQWLALSAGGVAPVGDLEEKARELLADALDSVGATSKAARLRQGVQSVDNIVALRAIIAALRSTTAI